MLDAIGWVATAVFSASYLFRSGAALRRVQAAAALLWIAYGVAIASKPVIAANTIVALAAIASALRTSQRSPAPTCRR
jgi:hypothetical protein